MTIADVVGNVSFLISWDLRLKYLYVYLVFFLCFFNCVKSNLIQQITKKKFMLLFLNIVYLFLQIKYYLLWPINFLYHFKFRIFNFKIKLLQLVLGVFEDWSPTQLFSIYFYFPYSWLHFTNLPEFSTKVTTLTKN